ncbi:hypothetical protein ACFPFV_06835 [Salinicoccus siamensis]|uniref:hypothetical protein n=1 Tax=Salinicoccus siamensis TaxID=381830 RepID=UPI0036074BF3
MNLAVLNNAIFNDNCNNSTGLEGYFKTHINVVFRIVLIASALLLTAPETYTNLIGVAAAVIILVMNRIKWKRERHTAS